MEDKLCPCLKFILVYVLSVGKVAKVAKVAGFMYGGGERGHVGFMSRFTVSRSPVLISVIC